MKSYGCDFCNDVNNIEPAKSIDLESYIDTDVKNREEVIQGLKKMLKEEDKKKKFVRHFKNSVEICFAEVSTCPKCGYKFTEEDYDTYM